MLAALRPAPSATTDDDRRRPLGFTLIELIVVIVLLGILAALAVPAFDAVQRRTRIEGRVIEVVALAREAAALAAFNDADGWQADDWTTAANDVVANAADSATSSTSERGYDIVTGDAALEAPDQLHLEFCDSNIAGVAALVPGVDDVVALVAVNRNGIAIHDGWAPKDQVANNGKGALAFHGFDETFCAASPNPAPSPTISTQVIEGPEVTCEYTIDGQVHCYGRNYYGATGHDRVTYPDVTRDHAVSNPLEVDGVTVNDVQEVVVGERVTAVRTKTAVIVVGSTGDNPDGTPIVREPTVVANLPGTPVEVVVNDRTVVVRTDDNQVRLIGRDPITDTIYTPEAPQVLPTPPGEVAELECSANFICVLLVDGTVWCIGWNDHGQLGAGLPTDHVASDWVQVERSETLMLTGAADLALGERHAAVRTSAGAAFAWGRAELGATGDDNAGPTATDRSRAAQVCDLDTAGRCTDDGSPHLAGVTELFPAGPDHTCVTVNGGSYACWGSFDGNTFAVPHTVTELPSRWQTTTDGGTGTTSPEPTPVAYSGAWETVAGTHPNVGLAGLYRLATYADGKVYASGHYSYSSSGQHVQLDPATDAWTTMPQLSPGMRRHQVAVSPGGTTYFVGGCQFDCAVAGGVYAYDPAAPAALVKVADLVQPGTTHAINLYDGGAMVTSDNRLVVTGGRVYNLNGYGQHGQTAYTFVLDLDNVAAGWSWGPTRPYQYVNFGTVAVGDTLYVTGGSNGSGTVYGYVYSLDLSNPAATWQQQPSLRYGRSGAGMAALGADGKIYVGGGAVASVSSYVDVFDPGDPSGGWQAGPRMPGDLADGSLATAGNGSLYGYASGILYRLPLAE